MTMTIDPVDLARALIAAPSVTPATGAVFDVLEAALAPLGFTVERFIDGIEPDGPVENLLAVRAGSGPVHFGFAGHLDVVPPGVGWTGDAFAPEIRGDLLYGRGAVDMKGSVNIWIDVPGTQGHVAYPHLADNPIPKLVRILAAIDTVTLDEGTAWFQPSNIEFTDLEVGNGATNVIPASARARLSIRFNDQQKGADLVAMVERIAQDVEPAAKVIGKISGEAFLTPPGALSSLVAEAIRAETGIEADMSTTGGTSDARFLHALCPVVEFGLTNATMHKLDEAVAVEDLHNLTAIYRGILDRAFR